MRHYAIAEVAKIEPESSEYDSELRGKLFGGTLGRCVSAHRKSLDGTEIICEFHDTPLPTKTVTIDGEETEQSRIGDAVTEEEHALGIKVDNHTKESLEDLVFYRAVEDGIIKAFGHWPHTGDGHRDCIFCYLKANKEKWEAEDPVE